MEQPDLLPIQKKALKEGVDLNRLPAHVGVIMDGNGRFATNKGLMRLKGHYQGLQTLKKVLQACSDLGIGYLTVYGFSAENWRRPEAEVSGLMKLIEGASRNEIKKLMKNNVRARVIGRKSELPASLQDAIKGMEETTAGNTGIGFTLAINYGGRAEIVDAVKGLVASGVDPASIDEDVLSRAMYCAELPDPDLIVRTAGEMRWSNFLIWQAAYAELYVTDITWPEFGEKDLLDAVIHYQKRVRKFGGLA